MAPGEIVVQEPTPQAISYTYGPITHPQGAEPDGVATLQLGGGGVRGITVNGNATAPADYNGSLGFIQLVQSVRSYRDPNNNLYRFDTADHTASGYAYDNTPEAATVIYGDNAVSLPAGETSPEPTQILDSPFEHRNATYEYVGAHDDFSAFLMFKPLAADAIWVTIRKFKWGWEADASNAGTQGNPNWQAGVGEKTEPALQGPSTQLPEWDARVQDLATPNNYELVT